MQIDREFQTLLAPLSDEEFAGLEQDILQDGCRVPLDVWRGILIDGHNRHAICTKHGLPYRTAERDFEDREAVKTWIIRNQLNRRNLKPNEVSYLRGKLYEQSKKNVGRPEKCGNNYHISEPEQTAERIGEQYGVTEKTIRNDAAFAAAVDAIAETAGEEVKQQILAGDLPVTKKDVVALAQKPAKRQAEIINKVKSGKAKSVKDAERQERQDAIRQTVEEAARTSTQRAKIRRLEASAFLKECDPHSIDLLITDPPYATDVDDITQFAYWLMGATPKLKPTGRAYICIGPYPLEVLSYLERLREARWIDKSQILVWTYRNTIGPAPSHTYKNNWQAILYLSGRDAPPLDCPLLVEQFSVQDINAPDGRLGNRYHAWQKPDELAERLIRHSTKPGDLVVDPFAGTGTFLLAAAKLNRQAVGADISDESLMIAQQRGCIIE